MNKAGADQTTEAGASEKQRGAALIELALILPLLLALFFGFVEIGRALYQHNALTKAMTTGARYIARMPEAVSDSCAQGSDWNSAVQRAESLVVFPRGEDAGALLPGFSNEQLMFQVRAGSSGSSAIPMCILQASATVEFSPLSGETIIPFLNLGRFNLTASVEERYIGD